MDLNSAVQPVAPLPSIVEVYFPLLFSPAPKKEFAENTPAPRPSADKPSEAV